MKAPLGVILAGGEATRMGGTRQNPLDKSLLGLNGRPVLQHVIDRLLPQVPELILNANGDAHRFAGFGLRVVSDAPGRLAGPLAGVLAGLEIAREKGFDHIVTAAADTPFLPPDLVPRLLHATEASGAPVVLAATPCSDRGQQRQPTFGLWSVTLLAPLRAALDGGLRKIVAFTQSQGGVYAEFELLGKVNPFFNINTPADMQMAQAIISGEGV